LNIKISSDNISNIILQAVQKLVPYLMRDVRGSQFDKACPELAEGLTVTTTLSP